MSIASSPLVPEEIHRTLHAYLDRHRPGDMPISISDAVSHLRIYSKCLGLSDRNLSELVADHAILRGFNLHFDSERAA
jgi:hypothetical protein